MNFGVFLFPKYGEDEKDGKKSGGIYKGSRRIRVAYVTRNERVW